jgi:hypothetical protein
MKTIEQLKQEAAAAAAELAAAEKVAAAAADEAKAAAARERWLREWQAHHAAALTVARAIVAALPERSAQVTNAEFVEPQDRWAQPRMPGVLLAGETFVNTIEIDAVRVKSSRLTTQARVTGQFRVLVGARFGGEQRTTFPPRRDGTHNYPKIAERVAELLAARAERVATEAAQKQLVAEAGSIVSRLKSKFPSQTNRICAEYSYPLSTGSGRPEWRTRVAPAGKVLVKLPTLALTEAQAERVLRVLEELKA